VHHHPLPPEASHHRTADLATAGSLDAYDIVPPSIGYPVMAGSMVPWFKQQEYTAPKERANWAIMAIFSQTSMFWGVQLYLSL